MRKAHMELVGGTVNALTIGGVDDIDEAIGVLEVISPERAELLLPTDIPDGEAHVFVLHLLNVESDCRNSCLHLANVQLVPAVQQSKSKQRYLGDSLHVEQSGIRACSQNH